MRPTKNLKQESQTAVNPISTKEWYDMAIKKSVSMPRRMFEFAIGRQQQLQYSTFSDYIQSLVRKDIESCERSVVISNLPTERQKLAAARRKAPAGHK